MKYCIECNKKNIKKIASYGNIDEEMPKYCSDCSKDKEYKIVNFKHGYCKYILDNSKKLLSEQLCGENANFNYVNSDIKKGIRCIIHKKENMICINAHLCKDCKILVASFIDINSKKKTATHCSICASKHADIEFIDIAHKKCKECNRKNAIFGLKDNINTKEYCKECVDKLNIKVINNHHKKCITCNIRNALYNYDSEYIYNKQCLICNKIPIFGYENKGALYCNEHKLEGMIDIIHHKCIICKINRALFNNYGEKIPLYCNEHKTILMVNLQHKLCSVYLCGKRAIDKYDNHCLTCYIYLNPDKSISRNFKSKESHVVQYIIQKFPETTWITDKKIKDGCSLKRPDLLLDLGYQVINIEIDKNQHKSYEEIYENKRLMFISQDLQHRNLILIRFNPDSYTKNKIKNASCWKVNKYGLSTIKNTYQKEWSIRLKDLEDVVRY